MVRYHVSEADGNISEKLMTLTRLLMGDRQAPAVAQWVLDILVFPLLRLSNVKTFTMRDNVRIAANISRLQQGSSSPKLSGRGARSQTFSIMNGKVETVDELTAAGEPTTVTVQYFQVDAATGQSVAPRLPTFGQLLRKRERPCRLGGKNVWSQQETRRQRSTPCEQRNRR